jgi:hypothetical protein
MHRLKPVAQIAKGAPTGVSVLLRVQSQDGAAI